MSHLDRLRVCETLEYSTKVNEDRGKKVLLVVKCWLLY